MHDVTQFCSKCTTLTSLQEVHLSCSFFSLLPLPRTRWRYLHFHKKWQRHSAPWNNVLLYLQETTVGGLLFGISASFCYFSRLFAKEKRILHFAFLYLLPVEALRTLDKHPLISRQAADGQQGCLGPAEHTLPYILLGWLGGRGGTRYRRVCEEQVGLWGLPAKHKAGPGVRRVAQPAAGRESLPGNLGFPALPSACVHSSQR